MTYLELRERCRTRASLTALASFKNFRFSAYRATDDVCFVETVEILQAFWKNSTPLLVLFSQPTEAHAGI